MSFIYPRLTEQVWHDKNEHEQFVGIVPEMGGARRLACFSFVLESHFLYPLKGVRELGTVPAREPGTVPPLGGPFSHYQNVGFGGCQTLGPNERFWCFSFCLIRNLLGASSFSDLLVTLLFASLCFERS